MRKLPTFKGYTIDERLEEFRKVTFNKKGEPNMETIPFDSEKGEAMLFAINLRTALRAKARG